LELAAALK
jgi:chromosome segregation ATPase